MRIDSVSFVEHGGTPKEWRLQSLKLTKINLIVGQNAAGKSRTLNVILYLANLIRGRKTPPIGGADWTVRLTNTSNIDYSIQTSDENVRKETFKAGSQVLLERGQDGAGKIFATELNQEMQFQAPISQVAVLARRDSIQHPFFEPLHQWAQAVRYYAFGTPLGKTVFAVFTKEPKQNPREVDINDQDQVVAMFRKGLKQYGDEFHKAIVVDMTSIGYEIEDITVETPTSMRVEGPLPGEIVGLSVKERQLRGRTEQFEMSQGMFRALSVIIQLNYSHLASKPTCILIDDIGEGLDYERSCALIDLLMTKAKQSGVQLIMTTNDRFVMNKVPLEAWTVLVRDGSEIRVFNYANSKEVFENFRFTGLSNFDFFSSEYFKNAKVNA